MFDSDAVDEPRLSWLLEREAETRRLDAQTARHLASLDSDASTDLEYGLTAAAWLADRTGRPVGVCRRLVRHCTKLVDRFPLVLAALESGEIGWEHVQVILDAANPRILGTLIDFQELILDVARNAGHFGQFRDELGGLAKQLDLDGGYDPNRDNPGRLHVSTVNGDLVIGGTATDEDAILIGTAIEAFTDEEYKRAARDHEQNPDEPIPHRSILRMRALAHICRLALGRDVDDTNPPRVEANVVVTADTGQVTTADGTPVSKPAVKILLADAMWRSVRIDENGNPLDVGRAHRYATTQQRVALLIRDGGCTFPGCDRPAHWCDAHHVQEWDDDGETNMDNLLLLCRHHHRLTHRPGWTLTADLDPAGEPTQWFTWTAPTGRTLHNQRHHRQRKPDREPRAA